MTNWKKSSIRPVGQRSITTTFPFLSANQSTHCNSNFDTKKGSKLSLSEFLNRKLHNLPKSVPGKEVAFSSPLTGEGLNKVAVVDIHGEHGEAKTTLSLDGIFHMFKSVNKKNEKDVEDSNSSENVESFGMNDLQQVGKRKNLFQGIDHKPSNVKRLAVLGEDLKPTHRSKRKDFKTTELKPFFNHYKSGGGWWDENMEGLDNEAVGCKDAWEGVGSTTLGAL